ncbi:MAG: NADH-quinone oxidoreductase subunit H [Bacillota bacterium]
MNSIFYLAIQIAAIVLVAPLVNGLIRKVKAFTQKRTGPPVLQMYFDLYKLFKKEAVVSEVTSWVYKVAPYIVFATTLAAAMLVPVTTLLVPFGFPGDVIMLIYIFALGRFFLALAGLDAGSTFGGMGSSREGMISALMEPAILVSVFTVGLISKSTSVLQMMEGSKSMGIPLSHPVYLLVFLALLIIIIAETARIPVDDPSTHLELTMVHEAMVLEYSGRHLALMELGAAVKQLVLITFVVNVFLPHDQLLSMGGPGVIAISLLIYLAKVILFSVIMALIEVNTVKFRFFSVPNLAALSFILAFLGFLNQFVLS